MKAADTGQETGIARLFLMLLYSHVACSAPYGAHDPMPMRHMVHNMIHTLDPLDLIYDLEGNVTHVPDDSKGYHPAEDAPT